MKPKLTRTRSGPQKTLVGFFLGDVHYAIDVARVLQILRPLPTIVLPHLPVSLAGVAEHRGEVLPVVDLRVRFGLEAWPETRETKWILLAVGSQPAAVIVDGITDVFGTSGAELRPAPGIAGEDQRGILGVTSHAGRLTFVLDIERLRPLLASLPSGLAQSMAPYITANGRPSMLGSKA